MTLPSHLFVASDGDLFDCRQPAWAANPLRRRFRWHHVNIASTQQFKATLRAGAFAWPGGYPLFFLCDDGGSLCFDCAREDAREIMGAIRWRQRNGWRVLACDVNWEDPDLFCDGCNERIESAYGDA